MNTLSDTLNDLSSDVLGCIDYEYELHWNGEKLKQILEKYVERIKNELNVEKYLK